MQTERGAAFIDNEPTLTAEDAHKEFLSGQAALSLKGLPCPSASGTIEYLAVKFSLANGNFATVLLDRMAAGALTKLIAAADSIQWDGNALRAGPTAH